MWNQESAYAHAHALLSRHCILSRNRSVSLAVVPLPPTTSLALRPITYFTSTPITLALQYPYVLPLGTHPRGMSVSHPQKRMAPIESATRIDRTARCTMCGRRRRRCLYVRTLALDHRFRTGHRCSLLHHSSSNCPRLPRPPPNRSRRSPTISTTDGSQQVYSRTIRPKWTRANSDWGWTSTRCNATSSLRIRSRSSRRSTATGCARCHCRVWIRACCLASCARTKASGSISRTG